MTFKPLHLPSHLYFVTGALLGWQPLFTHPDFALIVLNSLKWHQTQGRFALYAYVIMPTHFHTIIKPVEDRTISDNLQSLGSFTAHAILKKLRADGFTEALKHFADHRSPDRSEEHQIWQPMQAKNVFSPEFLREKLEYIHNNPIAKKWQLAGNRAEYRFSSARFYDLDEEPIIPVDDVRELL